MEIAAKAEVTALELLGVIPEDQRPFAAEKIARLINFGIRVSPRAVHSTVRINAVKRATRSLPVKCRLVDRVDEITGFGFKALETTPG
jgi:hypothetical protein